MSMVAGVDFTSDGEYGEFDDAKIVMDRDHLIEIAKLLRQAQAERGIAGEQGALIDSFAGGALRHFGIE